MLERELICTSNETDATKTPTTITWWEHSHMSVLPFMVVKNICKLNKQCHV